jgi:hypothetical protein
MEGQMNQVRKLPADVARCAQSECQRKEMCMRWLSESPNPQRQVWMKGPLEDCDYYLENTCRKIPNM